MGQTDHSLEIHTGMFGGHTQDPIPATLRDTVGSNVGLSVCLGPMSGTPVGLSVCLSRDRVQRRERDT
jgi:hypothetical protein